MVFWLGPRTRYFLYFLILILISAFFCWPRQGLNKWFLEFNLNNGNTFLLTLFYSKVNWKEIRNSHQDPIIFSTTSVDGLRFLIENGVSVDEKASWGDTPLYREVQCDIYGNFSENKELIKFLLGKGANVNIICHEMPLLHVAIHPKADLEVINLFLDKGADVNYPGYLGFTALDVAFLSKRPDIIKLLLKFGAKIELMTERGEFEKWVQEGGLGNNPMNSALPKKPTWPPGVWFGDN